MIWGPGFSTQEGAPNSTYGIVVDPAYRKQ